MLFAFVAVPLMQLRKTLLIKDNLVVYVQMRLVHPLTLEPGHPLTLTLVCWQELLFW